MTRKHYIMLFIIALALLSGGVYITFDYSWRPKIEPPVIGLIFSFFCFGGSALLFSAFFTWLFFIPKNVIHNFFARNDTKERRRLEGQTSKSKARKIIIIRFLLLVLTFASFVLSTLFMLGKYENYQLRNFGKEQVIEISEITKGYKGIDVAVVTYKYGDKFYSKEFRLNKYKAGEKVSILFSTQDPMIAVWKDEFKTSVR